MYKIALENVENFAMKIMLDCKNFAADKGYNENWVLSRLACYLSAQLWSSEKRRG